MPDRVEERVQMWVGSGSEEDRERDNPSKERIAKKLLAVYMRERGRFE